MEVVSWAKDDIMAPRRLWAGSLGISMAMPVSSGSLSEANAPPRLLHHAHTHPQHTHAHIHTLDQIQPKHNQDKDADSV